MSEILGKTKTVRELMKGAKYSIDYYQREYKWGQKQATELVDDLVRKFEEKYEDGHERKEVACYPYYFLGSIIISKKDGKAFIVDGQQRLTTLSLLIIMLHRIQLEQRRKDTVPIEELVFSDRYGDKSFNLKIDDRKACMKALFEGQDYDIDDAPESVKNLYGRYQDIEVAFPSYMHEKALPYFIDWLLENVHLVEITAYSDNDAYTIFETMNDRGLSLSPTDMLKSYLLANIDEDHREDVSKRWKDRIRNLSDYGKNVDADFFKAWFRSQYATKIRERKKDTKHEDFDRIGTEYHRWFRDSSQEIDLKKETNFLDLINTDFDFYSKHYLNLLKASETVIPGLEHVRYNALNGFTLQYMLLLAPLKPSDSSGEIAKKIRITSKFIDILLTWRIWNSRSIAYSTVKYAMFSVMRDIRGSDVKKLVIILSEKLQEEEYNFDKIKGSPLLVHQQNRKRLHHILARMTAYVEDGSGMASHFEEFIDKNKKGARYEVEHIWADKFSRHTNEFQYPDEFANYRNRIGGLLLLPKQFNASYGGKPYSDKLEHYNSHNILARSLHPNCYENNPGFMRFIKNHSLSFEPMPDFKKANLDARSELYRQIAKLVWNPDSLMKEVS